MADDDKTKRAAELDRAIKEADAAKKRAKRDDGDDDEAAAGKELDKQLTSMLDAVTRVSDVVAGLARRMDTIEAADRVRRLDTHETQPARDVPDRRRDLPDDRDLDFDELPEDEQARLVAQETERDPTKAVGLAAQDAARKSYADSIRGMSSLDRQDHRESMIAHFQSAADSVFNELGSRAPKPMAGERPRSYRRRCLNLLKRYSPSYKDADLAGIANAVSFRNAEASIFADARREAAAPTVPLGQLRCVEKRQPDGHLVREFYGSTSGWMDALAGPRFKAIGSWNTRGIGNTGS